MHHQIWFVFTEDAVHALGVADVGVFKGVAGGVFFRKFRYGVAVAGVGQFIDVDDNIICVAK